MTKSERFIALVTKVTSAAREFTPRQTVELGVLHGLCLDAARNHDPDLVDFIASVRGLAALSVTLSQLPHLVVANDLKGAEWTFVRPN